MSLNEALTLIKSVLRQISTNADNHDKFNEAMFIIEEATKGKPNEQ